jgi:hypothetical protein
VEKGSAHQRVVEDSAGCDEDGRHGAGTGTTPLVATVSALWSTASVAMGKGDEQLDVRRTLGRRRSVWAGAWTGGDCRRRELGQAAIGVGRELGRAAGSAARMTGRAMTRTAAFGEKTGGSFFFTGQVWCFFFEREHVWC